MIKYIPGNNQAVFIIETDETTVKGRIICSRKTKAITWDPCGFPGSQTME